MPEAHFPVQHPCKTQKYVKALTIIHRGAWRHVKHLHEYCFRTPIANLQTHGRSAGSIGNSAISERDTRFF